MQEEHSLNELMTKSQEFLEDKIFELTRKEIDKEGNGKFQYVLVKVKHIKETESESPFLKKNRHAAQKGPKTLVQIIDMSDKILYNELNAQKSFLTLINATLSHELRNPLSSLLDSREQIVDLLEDLHGAIKEVANPEKLQVIYNGLEKYSKKIFTASKFIDYYVHDMLDYSILIQDDESFSQNVTVFDIKNALEEIVDMYQDKVNMKFIKVDHFFKGFREFEVNSDMRRIQ